MTKTLRIKSPGKLMVAGEFAVLEPNQKLIVMAIDRFVDAKIADGLKNSLTLEDLGLKGLHFQHQYKNIHIETTDERIGFVRQAMLITCDYLYEKSIVPKPFSLHIKSELDDESGKKYGLGSSAAVVTAVVTAILTKNLNNRPSPELIFKLASISHVITQGNGSGADIAASAYGGVLEYTSFQAEWLLKKLRESRSLVELVEEKWTYLSIKRLQMPVETSICIGWTGTPASTANLVTEVLKLKTENPETFNQFLAGSSVAVDTILKGIENRDLISLFEGIKKNRRCLAGLGEQANVSIETPLLKDLAIIAEQFGGAGKLSGAGGGDCGIAFIPSEENDGELQQAWKLAGIIPLAMDISTHGAMVIDGD